MSNHCTRLIRSIVEAEHRGDSETAADLRAEFSVEAEEEPAYWRQQLEQARSEYRDCGVTLADATHVLARLEIDGESYEEIFEGVEAGVRWAVQILVHEMPNEDRLPPEYWGRDGIAQSLNALLDWDHERALHQFLRGKDLSRPGACLGEILAFGNRAPKPTAWDHHSGRWTSRTGGGAGTTRIHCEVTWG
jgi:hypothetical protein